MVESLDAFSSKENFEFFTYSDHTTLHPKRFSSLVSIGSTLDEGSKEIPR